MIDTFEVGILSNGRETLDEAAKLFLIQDWVINSKGKKKSQMSQDTVEIVEEHEKVKLLENAFFAEFSLGLYIHH